MNICINIYGKQIDLSNTKNMIDNYIVDNKNNFHILYTGWNNEENIFENIFENSYIKRYNIDQNILEDLLKKYEGYKSDPTNGHKSFTHILLGLYIKNKSKETIKLFCDEKNIKFDFIITLRTDTKLSSPIFNDYNKIIDDLDKIFISKESYLDYNIYNNGGYSDFIVISNYNNMVNILDQLNNIDKCIFDENKFFHPETAFYKYLNSLKVNIKRLNFISCRSDQCHF